MGECVDNNIGLKIDWSSFGSKEMGTVTEEKPIFENGSNFITPP